MVERSGISLITVFGFIAGAVLLGWIVSHAAGKWTSLFLGGLLAIILALGFAVGLVDLLQGYAMANQPVANDTITASAEQAARSQEIASFCDDCHSTSDAQPLGSPAVSISGDASIVFMPLELFKSASGVDSEQIVAYPQAPGPDLRVVVSHWSETDFVNALRAGKNPQGQGFGRGMPRRDIATIATDDDLRTFYEYLQRQTQIDK